MITRKAVLILLFALFVFVVPALSQDIHEAVKDRDFKEVKALVEKNPTAVKAKDDRS